MIYVVIPAYNEEKTIGEVIKKCRTRNAECQIIVVDDESSDKTAEVAREAGALVLSHPINRGLGATLATGIEGALTLIEQNPSQSPFVKGGGKGDLIVTLDADGQHDPAEISKLIEPILRGEADVVIGSRFLFAPVVIASPASQYGVNSAKQSSVIMGSPHSFGARDDTKDIIPFSRRVANTVGNVVTYLLFGIRVTDSQSGFRAFSREAAEKLRIRTNTMEVSSEIIREVKLHNWRLKEVPIKAIYTDYSLSKGQGFLKGLETLWKLIVLKFFR
ncbi:MAG: glycosyltransferase family 2 protein [bacterium]|nr:glycosyltransferase family 2 protein [bacterium]